MVRTAVQHVFQIYFRMSNGIFGGRESADYVGYVPNNGANVPNVNMMDGPQVLNLFGQT